MSSSDRTLDYPHGAATNHLELETRNNVLRNVKRKPKPLFNDSQVHTDPVPIPCLRNRPSLKCVQLCVKGR